jgi:hypothetical protein
MDCTGGTEDLKRRRRLEKAAAMKREWWTCNFEMDWLENNSTAEIVQFQDISDMECGTAPPLPFPSPSPDMTGDRDMYEVEDKQWSVEYEDENGHS